MSDFPKAAARISEGFCPLCDQQLGDKSFCGSCDVGWSLDGRGAQAPEDVQIFGTAGVLVTPSRRLNSDEVKRLYLRSSTGDRAEG